MLKALCKDTNSFENCLLLLYSSWHWSFSDTSDAITTRTSEFFGAMKKAKVEDPNAEYEGICAVRQRQLETSRFEAALSLQNHFYSNSDILCKC